MSRYKTAGGVKHEFFTDTPIKTATSDGELIFSDKTKQRQRMILKMMEFLLEITKKHKIEWFAICGTLLGAVRNQGIIPYDDDGDIGFLMSEYEKFMKLTRMDLHPQFQFVESESGVQLVQKKEFAYITHFDFIAFDICKDDPDKLVYAGPIWNNKPTFYGSQILENEWIYKRDVDKLIYRKFEHLLIPTPENVAEYLTHVYGNDCLTVYVPDTRNLDGFHLHELYMSIISPEQRLAFRHTILDIIHPLELHKPNLNSRVGLLISRILAIPLQMNNDIHKSIRMVNDAITKYIHANI